MKRKIIYSIFIVPVSLLILGTALFCNRISDPKRSDRISIEGKISEYVDLESQQGFSGIVAVRHTEFGLLFFPSGYADESKQIPVNEHSVFDIGSLTKQFTGAAILMLEIENKLSINDSLKKFFPYISDDKASITLHQLLIHTSGFPQGSGSDFEKLNKEVFLDRTLKTPLKFAPGQSYLHSHIGYSILGIVIEEVTGLSYEKYLSTSFFTPLEMQKTGYVLPVWDQNEVANGYRKCKNWGKPMDLNWDTEGPNWNIKANSGLLSTAFDLMLWQEALENNLIFTEEQKERYLNPYMREGQAKSYYSYGWMITKSSRGTRVYAHEGGNGKFFSDWINYPDDGVSVLVLSNDWIPGYWNVASEIARIIFYPHHEPSIQLAKLECFSSFPDSRQGQIAQTVIDFFTESGQLTSSGVAEACFGDYVHQKYESQHIINTLESCRKDCGPAEVSRIILYNNDFMEIEMSRISDQKRIQIQLNFDKEDRYMLKKMRYDSNQP